MTIAVLASGCANVTGWQPTVDARYDRNPQAINFDMQDCQRLASEAAGTGSNMAMGAGVGGLGGAAAGAALGAIAGSPANGAALGAAIGLAGGTGYTGMQANDRYKNALMSCMRQRGHTVM